MVKITGDNMKVIWEVLGNMVDVSRTPMSHPVGVQLTKMNFYVIRTPSPFMLHLWHLGVQLTIMYVYVNCTPSPSTSHPHYPSLFRHSVMGIGSG